MRMPGMTRSDGCKQHLTPGAQVCCWVAAGAAVLHIHGYASSLQGTTAAGGGASAGGLCRSKGGHPGTGTESFINLLLMLHAWVGARGICFAQLSVSACSSAQRTTCLAAVVHNVVWGLALHHDQQ